MADLLVGMTLKEAKRLDDALLHLKNSYSLIKANKPFKRLHHWQLLNKPQGMCLQLHHAC